MSAGLAAGSARERMIVALDLADVPAAAAMVERLGDTVTFYKIGMELTYAGGLPLVRHLVESGRQVFLDLKLHDIPHTVEAATARLAHLGATYLTVHAYPQTMAAAHRGRQGSGLKILGVTVLTSMADADLAAAGYRGTVGDIVAQRAKQAGEAGSTASSVRPPISRASGGISAMRWRSSRPASARPAARSATRSG